MEKTKKQQLEVFKDNFEVTVKAKMECAICGDEYDKEFFEDEVDGEKLLKKSAEAAYKDGWRYSTSEVYAHIGIHCPNCHKERNNPKHWT